MTMNDIHNLIEIIDECKNRERKLAEDYIKLNPEDADRRNRIASDICSGIDDVWLEIRRKYSYLWEGNK